MLEFLELFGTDRSAVEQAPVTVLTLANPVDLGLQPGDLGVEILQCDIENGQPVCGLTLIRQCGVVALLFGKVGGAVRQPTQLGIDLGETQQRTLLCYFTFQCTTLISRYSRDRCAANRR